jgi:serine/threonine protein kinase
MNLLIKLGRFSEEMSRFYIAELVMVVESVHQMGFIHRDIKVRMVSGMNVFTFLKYPKRSRITS